MIVKSLYEDFFSLKMKQNHFLSLLKKYFLKKEKISMSCH